jgi:hypothetical protein
MTTDKQNWINSFITKFQSTNTLAEIAYVSADNEINNHCGGYDCFDNNDSYVIAADNWTAAFTSIFRSRNVHILTTVGISTEVTSRDQYPAENDFFRIRGTAPNLASSVDFVSPHNYGGGAHGVYHNIRLRYPNGAITLEEYGFPTDPVGRSALYTEGPTGCRANPYGSGCANTAPWFVEQNIQAIWHWDSYAGGVAWMVADVNHNSCSVPMDFFTGLFTAGGPYCGGTYTASGGNPKATGFRIRNFYYNWP